MSADRDRDALRRPRQARPRDELGRPAAWKRRGRAGPGGAAAAGADAGCSAEPGGRQGRPFAAHEVLEASWKAGPAEERSLWQGLAQLCVGLTHAAQGNSVGALRLVERGAARLEEYSSGGGPTYGLDLSVVVGCARDRMRTGG